MIQQPVPVAFFCILVTALEPEIREILKKFDEPFCQHNVIPEDIKHML